jgi:hypothetical protein
MHHEEVGVASGQHAAADADRGHREETVCRRLHGVRQLHAADVVVLGGAQHARGGIGLLRLKRGLRQDDLFAIELRLLRIDQPVEGRVLLARDALAGVQHGVEGFPRVVGKAGPLAQ